ncbi:hypothetical protein Peur_039885 [Populus x canadensis]
MTWLHHFTDSCEQIWNYDWHHSRTAVNIPKGVVKCSMTCHHHIKPCRIQKLKTKLYKRNFQPLLEPCETSTSLVFARQVKSKIP